MTREQRFARLEQNIERLLHNGRIFVLRGWELSGMVEMANDAEVEIEVQATNSGGWWIKLA